MSNVIRLPLLPRNAVAGIRFTRGECAGWVTPCELHGCRYNLHETYASKKKRPRPHVWKLGPRMTERLADDDQEAITLVTDRALKIMRSKARTVHVVSPADELLHEVSPWCTLDFADGGLGLRQIANLVPLTRSGIGIAIERSAKKLRAAMMEYEHTSSPRRRTVFHDLIRLLAQQDLDLEAICERTGWSRETVCHRLRSLVATGNVRRKGRDTYTLIRGTSQDARRLGNANVRTRIREALNRPMTARAIAKVTGFNLNSVNIEIRNMVSDGLARCIEAGRGPYPATYGPTTEET